MTEERHMARWEGLSKPESREYLDLMQMEEMTPGQVNRLKSLHEKSERATNKRLERAKKKNLIITPQDLEFQNWSRFNENDLKKPSKPDDQRPYKLK